MTKNLTVGSPVLLIVSFAVPLLIGNLFQQFYSMADTLIVGRTIGVSALASVGCTGSINFLVLGFIIGFTQGAAIISSQCFGAGDEQGLRKSFAVSIVLAAGATVVFTLISSVSARPLLRLLRTPPEIIDQAYSYISIVYYGLGSMMLFNLCSNTMRSVGDSRSHLYFLIIACILNIIMDLVFILGFHTGVGGAAFATVLSQLFSGVLCISYIRKRLPVLKIGFNDFRQITKNYIITHLKMALPMGFQMSIIAIGTLTVQFALNELGTIAVAAFTAGQRIDQFATMPLASFGAAMVTYSAQNYGARKIERIRRGLLHCCIMSCSFALFMGILYFIAGNYFSSFFIGAQPQAVSLSHTYLKINGSFYTVLACLFIFRQSLQGLGNSIIPTIAGISELFMRTFAALILAQYFGFNGICFAGPLAYIGALIPLTVSIMLTMKKLSCRKHRN